MDENKEKNVKSVKKGLFRLVLIFLCLICGALTSLLYLYSEFFEAPEFARKMVADYFSSKGLAFKADRIRIGMTGAVCIDNIRVADLSAPSNDFLKASMLEASISLSKLMDGKLAVGSLSIWNASLCLPLFPEYESEASSDTLKLEKFNASITQDDSYIKLDYASCNLEKIEIKASGIIDNLPSAYLPDSKMAVKAMSSISTASPLALIRELPLNARKTLLRSTSRINAKNFNENPSCSIFFRFDMNDSRQNFMRMTLAIPEFEYGKLFVRNIQEEMTMTDGVISLDTFRMDLGDDQYCEASGSFSLDSGMVNGEISGTVLPDRFMLFLDDSSRKLLTEKVKFADEPVKFNGNLANYSIISGKYNGSLNVEIASATFNDMKLCEISAVINVDESGVISGHDISATLESGSEVRGDFELQENRFSGNFEGTVNLEELMPFVPPTAEEFIAANLGFENSDPVSFSGNISCDDLSKRDFALDVDIMAPLVEIRGLPFQNMSASVSVADNKLSVHGLDATACDELKITGDAEFLIDKNICTSSLLCLGRLDVLPALLEQDNAAFLASLIKDIKWPEKGNLTEASIEMHYRYDDKPFYFMSGSLVMTDFKFRDIKFNYGASRFIVDSDDLFIMPGLILESEQGQALMNVVYDGRKNKSSAQENSGINPNGTLNFNMQSSLKGQDILKCLYPEWKNPYLSFPYPVSLSASGFIDYSDSRKSLLEARMENGKCLWKRLPVENIDAAISYKSGKLNIRKAAATVCGGTAGIDYNYDFLSDTGNIYLDIKGADYDRMIRYLGKERLLGRKGGILSGIMESKIFYDGADQLLLRGNGKLSVEDTDLWSIPLFGEFLTLIGRSWSLNNFGKITRLDCNYTLDNDCLKTDSVVTNGSVVAVKGDGKYYWNQDEFEFRFRAELLKDALPFNAASHILYPVSWLSEAKVRGKKDKSRWEQTKAPF